MKINIILSLILLFLNSCDSFFLKPSEFKNDFKKHTSNSDSVLYDGDFLHPSYVFKKNGKISGIEFNGNPECGNYIRRYFLDEAEKIKKIVIEKDFYSEHCGKPFDSIYVILLPERQVKVHTKSTDGKIVLNNNLVEENLINISAFKNEIKKWQNR